MCCGISSAQILEMLWLLLNLFIYGKTNIDGSAQDCSIFITNVLEILQSFTKPSIINNLAQEMYKHA